MLENRTECFFSQNYGFGDTHTVFDFGFGDTHTDGMTDSRRGQTAPNGVLDVKIVIIL